MQNRKQVSNTRHAEGQFDHANKAQSPSCPRCSFRRYDDVEKIEFLLTSPVFVSSETHLVAVAFTSEGDAVGAALMVVILPP